MKILIVGGGGREHALAWRLAQSPSVKEIIATPGNPGITQVARCVALPAGLEPCAQLAEAERVTFTVVGPEATLVEGIVDLFQSRGLKIVGPTRAAARLEGSKIFSKRFFERTGIPSARSIQTTSAQEAIEGLKQFSFPVVVKADGLAGGKGVVIGQDHSEALQAIQQLGPNLVIEEFLEGNEVSFIGLSNGREIVPFAPTQDHKRLGDGDQGPNTGGMGAYCDRDILSDTQTEDIMDRVMMPALYGMRAQGHPFTGFLYAGLMMTPEGPKVLEFNVRLGDPETQSLMYGLKADLASCLYSSLHTDTPVRFALNQATPAACVVLAAAGYPQSPRLGDAITGIEAAEAAGAKVFHAGTKLAGGTLVTSGGRVLGVTAGAESLGTALEDAYKAVRQISFPGMHYRRDIGHKAFAPNHFRRPNASNAAVR